MGVRRGFSGPAAGAAKADPASAARPSLIDIERWFRQTLAGLSQISEKSKAVRYALNQRPALVFYVDDSVERALRAVAPGRKNYLHFGTDSGGDVHADRYVPPEQNQPAGLSCIGLRVRFGYENYPRESLKM